MKCYICDAEMSEVHLDAELKTMPCSNCLEAVDEALADFDDEPSSESK